MSPPWETVAVWQICYLFISSVISPIYSWAPLLLFPHIPKPHDVTSPFAPYLMLPFPPSSPTRVEMWEKLWKVVSVND